MDQKDFIYDQVFKQLINNKYTQKQAGDFAARAVNLFTHGRTYKASVDTVMKEAKQVKLKNTSKR
jgi:hypothetical protein